MIRYLALEGIDGAGKDVQLGLLARRMDRMGITPIVLQEPSYGVHGRALRARLAELPDDAESQRELFTRDRQDHWREKISPALELTARNPGFIVLQNRSMVSAAAYQPRGETDDELLRTVADQERIAKMPDLVVILDIPVEVALKRIGGRAAAPDTLESGPMLERVRLRYRRLAELLPACRVVNGEGDPDEIAETIMALAGQS